MVLIRCMDPFGLYLHIPFCGHQCPFCPFSAVQYSSRMINDYVKALRKEITLYSSRQDLRRRTLQSIYLGGGTPSLVPAAQLQCVLDLCRNQFTVQSDLEITLEATPESVHPNRIREWRSAGVNRLSIGAQSFSQKELEFLGRSHTVDQTRRAVFFAREGGMGNINLDLIYGLPGQSLHQWRHTVEEALALSPQHLSFYGLTLEEGTVFYESGADGRFFLPDEGEQARMYRMARELLLDGGYEQYEISNFSKPGYACRHNFSYWSDGEYVGLGASAHSHLNGQRFANCFDPQTYIDSIRTKESAVTEFERLPPERKAREAIALGLRRISGFNLEEILNRYPVRLPQAFFTTLEDFQFRGLLDTSTENLRLTPQGLLVADEVAAAVMAG